MSIEKECSFEVARIISKERERQGISVRKFADMIGASYVNVHLWNSRGITLDNAAKACRALGITVAIGEEVKKIESTKTI